ncbi:hypothetical protein CK220_27280 [Mesorhizobium sp. WSM3860]|nr:hypothetical protein CK220_27280 [Mesorhizobium sp. WSM3860]
MGGGRSAVPGDQHASAWSPRPFANKLRIVRPRLPDFVDRIELRGLRVGEASADLEFTRTADGAEVNIQKTSGQLSVEVGG